MKLNPILVSLAFIAGLFSSSAWSDIDTIDILAVYPASLADADPIARIANMEQYANKALKNSHANIRFRVVHIEELDIANAKTDSATLSQLRKNENAKNLRDKYGADLVVMLTPTGPYCGVGYVLGGYNDKIYSGHKNYGYSIVGHTCTSSFAHELGHNLSLGHSFKQGSRGGLYTWGRGHGVDHLFVTTMAYNSAYSAPKVQVFSNPNITICKDSPCGRPTTAKDAADATRVLNISGPQIATFYQPKSSIITKSNLSPILQNDTETILQGASSKINVLANDSDPEKDTLTIVNTSKPNHGSASIVGNAIQYTPNSSFVGRDVFQYNVSDGHNNTSTASVIVNVGLGVKYQYYEGYWPQLPDFSKLSPKTEGLAHNFTLTKRERKTNYAFRFTGQIDIPKTGSYTFFLKSDDNSKLLIDRKPIVQHTSSSRAKEAKNAVYLTAGLHRIEVQYSQLTGDMRLNIDWQEGSNGRRRLLTNHYLRSAEPKNVFPRANSDWASTQSNTPVKINVLKNDSDPDGDLIKVTNIGSVRHGTARIINNSIIVYTPNSNFTGTERFIYTISDGNGGFDRADVTVKVASGLAYEYFEGSWNKLPDFDKLKPVKRGFTNNFNLKERNRDNNFAFRYKARIKIPTSGNYVFYTISDDGSRLSIDGKVIADNDGLHSLHFRGGMAKLSKGYHDIEIEYFDKHGRERLMVVWGGGGKAVPFQYLTAKDLALPHSP